MSAFTIGHSTRSLGEFIALLKEAGVTAIADVRAFPMSRRHPHFNAENLGAALEAEGIAYRPMKALGGRRGKAKDAPSRNTLWREDGFRNYADYAETAPDFDAGFAALRGLVKEQPTAVMCAEAVWWRCHRRIIADYLMAAGEPVRHILAPGKIEPAKITEGARKLPNGKLRYAAPDLFNREEGKPV